MRTHHFMIAAPASGAGKTTLTLGLLAALHERGLAVQAFKSGPDYIDPKFHRLASKTASINLDQFFCTPEELKSLFKRYAQGKEVCVIEGVMGLFDGFDAMKGSSATLAKLLELPVVLVVNGASVAYSIGALLHGFKHFDPQVKIAGVIFNNVNSASHYRIMQEAAQAVGLTALGHVPRKADIFVSSRHLGLNIDTEYRIGTYAKDLASHIEQYVDIDLLLEKTVTEQPKVLPHTTKQSKANSICIAIAQDEAFNFIYPENIRLFQSFAKILYFSPLRDDKVPEADYVYLPGGYPELYIETLSKNHSMLDSIRTYAQKGGKIWAECGGMIYLCKALVDEQGNIHKLVAALDATATMEGMRLRLGYRQFEHRGITYKGHEFHYSSLLPNSLNSAAQLYGAKGQAVDTKFIKQNGIVASYTHLYLHKQNDFEHLFAT